MSFCTTRKCVSDGSLLHIISLSLSTHRVDRHPRRRVDAARVGVGHDAGAARAVKYGHRRVGGAKVDAHRRGAGRGGGGGRRRRGGWAANAAAGWRGARPRVGARACPHATGVTCRKRVWGFVLGWRRAKRPASASWLKKILTTAPVFDGSLFTFFFFFPRVQCAFCAPPASRHAPS